LAVLLLAFQPAANCERVTRRLLVELEVAQLTLPNGICIETDVWLVAEFSSGPIVSANSKRKAGTNLLKKGEVIESSELGVDVDALNSGRNLGFVVCEAARRAARLHDKAMERYQTSARA
jgi:hypothetical protein